MSSLSDAEILAALPVESRQKINNAFEALSQSSPSPAEQVILYRVAHTLKLNPTDTVFSVMAAMHYYLQLYQTIPTKIEKVGGGIRQAGFDVAEAIRRATKETLTEHAGALKVQAELIVAQSQQVLIRDVGKIAQKLAGDAAAVERHNSLVKASVFASIGVIFCAFIFGGGGVLFGESLSSSLVTSAQRELTEANLLLKNEKNRVDEKIAELEEKSAVEIEKIRAASGWLGTNDGLQVAGCKVKGWVHYTDPITGNPYCETRKVEKPTFGEDIPRTTFWMPVLRTKKK